jgi:hypothetical protein
MKEVGKTISEVVKVLKDLVTKTSIMVNIKMEKCAVKVFILGITVIYMMVSG